MYVWIDGSPLNCRLCLSYFYITQVWFSSSITECKALWDELKKSALFLQLSHTCMLLHGIRTAQELVDRIQADQTYRTRAFSMS